MPHPLDVRAARRTGRRTLQAPALPFALAIGCTLALPVSLRGQDPCDDPMNVTCYIPPVVSFTPASGTYFSSASQTLSVNWYDENGDLVPSSRSILLNGANVTSSFGFQTLSSTSATSSGTVTLAAGTNTLSATICDEASNCTTQTATYVYDSSNPTVSISPSGGTYSSASRSVTVSWGDNLGLNTASDTIWLGTTNVTASFAYSGTATSATSSGTVTLAAGTNTLKAKICDTSGRCTTQTATYEYAPPSAPEVSSSPHNGDSQDMGRCLDNCFDALVSYTTPAYVSLDTERSLTLVHSSGQALPRGRIYLDVVDTRSGEKPQKISLRIKNASGAWVTMVGGLEEVFFVYPGGADTVRIGAQFDLTDLATGAHTFNAVVRSHWPDGTVLEAPEVPLRVLVVNERASPYGEGWSIAGLQRLHFRGDSVAVSEGNGSIAFFRRVECEQDTCTYAGPPGDFSTFTLVHRLEGDTTIEGTVYVPDHYERRYVDGTTVHFTLAGRDSAVIDRFGNTTHYAYDMAGRLTFITDPANRTTQLSYDANGKLDYVQDPAGRTVQVTVSGGRLTEVVDPDGTFALQATYETTHPRIAQWTDRRGGQWDLTYDWTGRLQAIQMPTVRADSVNVRPTVTRRAVEIDVMVNTSQGLGTSTAPDTAVLARDNHAEVTNPRGHTTRIWLDRFGAPTRVEDPIGNATEIFRNANGLDTLIVAPSGHRVRQEWSGANRVKVHDLTTQRIVQFEYVAYGEVSRVYGDATPVWNYWSAGKLDSTRVGALSSPVTRGTYDSRGRILITTDPEGHQTKYFYSAAGSQNTDSVVAGPRRTAYTYDGFGRTEMVKDPLDRITRMAYDTLNRVIRTVGPAFDTTTYAYDALFLTEVRDPIGQTYRYYPNALGWNDSIVDPAGRLQRFQYDRNGNAVAHVNRRGQTTTSEYDALDRIEQFTLSDGRVTTYAYDPNGLWMAGSNGESTDTLKYDVAGRLTHQISRHTATGVRYVLESTYDDRNQRTKLQLTSPATHTIQFAHNIFGALGSLTNGVSETTTFAYNGDRKATHIQLPSVTVTKTIPSAHQTAGISYNLAPLNAEFGLNDRLDGATQVVERTSQAGDSIRTFQYDALGRLVRYEDFLDSGGGPCGFDEDLGFVCHDPDDLYLGGKSFTYDKVGNRTDTGASYETGNRLTNFDGWSLTYDADGNLTRKYRAGELDLYLYWNSIGQLDSVRSNGNIMRYGYDAFGRRIRKSGYSTHQRRFVYDGDDIFLELDVNTGDVLAEYSFYPGTSRPHSVRRDGSTYYYATDHLGTVLGLFRADTVFNSYRYDPWGQAEYASQPVYNSLRYAGSYYDNETAFYHMRARYYDRAFGRFISEDAIGLAGGINPYAYAGNNPIKFRDSFGMSSECPDGTWLFEMADGTAECKGPIALDGVQNSGSPGGNTSGWASNPSPRGSNIPRGGFNGGPGGGITISSAPTAAAVCDLREILRANASFGEQIGLSLKTLGIVNVDFRMGSDIATIGTHTGYAYEHFEIGVSVLGFGGEWVNSERREWGKYIYEHGGRWLVPWKSNGGGLSGGKIGKVGVELYLGGGLEAGIGLAELAKCVFKG